MDFTPPPPKGGSSPAREAGSHSRSKRKDRDAKHRDQPREHAHHPRGHKQRQQQRQQQQQQQHEAAEESAADVFLRTFDGSASAEANGRAFSALKSFFLVTTATTENNPQGIRDDHHQPLPSLFQAKAKQVQHRLVSLIDSHEGSRWAPFLLQWCVEVLEELPVGSQQQQRGNRGENQKDLDDGGSSSIQTDIEDHLGRLPNLYLASVVTRCLIAIFESEEGGLRPTDETNPLALLVQRAKSMHGKHQTLEWLVAFVGIHQTQEMIRLLASSIIKDLQTGHVADILQSPSQSFFGLRVLEYLSRRQPAQTADALRFRFLRFIRYTEADNTPEDVNLLAFFVVLAVSCPTATQLIIPLVLKYLSIPAVLERLIAREAVVPSHVAAHSGTLDVITEALLSHLPHMQSYSFEIVLLLESLRSGQINSEAIPRSLSISSLLDENILQGKVSTMDVEVLSKDTTWNSTIVPHAQTLLARILLTTQTALFQAIGSTNLRDRYLDHSLSNDGKTSELAFLYHLRQNLAPLAFLALRDVRHDSKENMFEFLLALVGLEGGQKCASEILYHLLTSSESHAVSVFLRTRTRFLDHYPDVYRICIQRVFDASSSLSDEQLLRTLTNLSSLLHLEVSTDAPPPSSTALLIASHWLQLFGLLNRPTLSSKNEGKTISLPIQSLLFPLLEAAVPSLADGDITLFHTCIEKTLLYFLALLPTTTTVLDDSFKTAASVSIEPVKRLLLRMANASPSSALPHILDLQLDFIFSPEADGIVRRKRDVIRAAKPLRTAASSAGATHTTAPLISAPVSKSAYVPPANAILQPTASFFSCLPLLSSSRHALHNASTGKAGSAERDELGASSQLGSGISLLEQNHKRKADVQYKANRAGLSIFEKTLLKKRKLGLDDDSSHYTDKVLAEAVILQHNQRQILDLFSLCVCHNNMERLSLLADLCLTRLTRTQDPTPTYDQYKEVLPRRPTFPRDQFIQKIFTQNPILVPLMELLAREPSVFYRCFEVIRSLMVYTISHWHAELTPDTKKSVEFNFTCRLLEMLRSVKWIPSPLCYCGEIFGEITPEEVTSILLAVWDFLHHSPPSPTQFFVSNYDVKPDEDKRQPITCNVDPFMRTLRNVLRHNVAKLANSYVRFF